MRLESGGERQPTPCTSDVSLYIPNLLDPDSDDELVDCLTAALRYAQAGWYVLPVLPGSKHPGSVVGARWQELSTRDPQVIAAHWTMTDYGIALHAGRSGAIIFDVDRPELLPKPLARAIRECNPPHQSTRSDVPGRGHYVFRVPPGRRFGNSRGRLFDAGTDPTERRHAWGEVRGANGVIVVSPSLHTKHAEGGRYLWI